MASVGGKVQKDGSYKIRWREKQPTGEWAGRSWTVSTPQAATQMKAVILRSLEQVGYWTRPTAPAAAKPPADLERAALAWIEAEKGRGIEGPTLRVRGFRLSVWHRALRAVNGIEAGAALPATALNRTTFAKALIKLAENKRSGERNRYDIACTAFAVWEWMGDEPETYPGLVLAPRDRTRLLPRTPLAPDALPAGTMPEMDAIVRGAIVVAAEARAGAFVLADLPDILAVQRYVGLRISSVTGIRLQDVFDDGQIKVNSDKVRSMRGRIIPVSPYAMAILKARADRLRAEGAPPTKRLFARVHDSAAIKAFRAAAHEIRPEIWSAGADRDGGRTTHCFRAALMEYLEGKGVKSKVIDRLVGHTSPDIRTKHYTPPKEAEMRAAVALIEPINHGPRADNVLQLVARPELAAV